VTRILLYEDNKSYRDGLMLLLNTVEDFSVVGSYKNCDSIEKDLTDLSPDVVLMDIEMPGTGGLNGLKKARSINPNVKIVMLTVFEDAENIFQALRFGADGYLLKKTPTIKIIEYIKEVLMGGAPMTLSIAKKVIESFKVDEPSHQPFEQLTNREKEVLRLVVEGNSYKMISDSLYISLDTVRSHIRNIYEKLQVNSKAEAIIKVLKKGGPSV
jgi:DNA-binding NarL/FixJ family response regulator